MSKKVNYQMMRNTQKAKVTIGNSNGSTTTFDATLDQVRYVTGDNKIDIPNKDSQPITSDKLSNVPSMPEDLHPDQNWKLNDGKTKTMVDCYSCGEWVLLDEAHKAKTEVATAKVLDNPSPALKFAIDDNSTEEVNVYYCSEKCETAGAIAE